MKIINVGLLALATGASAMLVPVCAIAEEAKIPVFLSLSVSNGDDVGSRLAFNIKERIRKSAGLKLVTDKRQAKFAAHIVTVQAMDRLSALSVTHTIKNTAGFDMYITSYVQTCGGAKVADCAESIVAEIDKDASVFGTP